MPKSKPKNAFFYFMLDWKVEQEKKNGTILSLKDVQADSKCSEAWKNLSTEKKAFYKNKAKTDKLQLQVEKKTTTGESLVEIERELIKQNKFIDDMTEYISLTVNQANINNDVPKLKFYVIHINYFYYRVLEHQEVRYCPAEIALAEFSLEKGVIRIYNKVINSEIEIGFSSDAKEHSISTHQIPRNPKFGENDYSVIFNEICQFIEPGKINGKFPPLYTRYNVPHIKETIISVLQEFTQIADSKHNILIYSLEELFMNLRNVNIQDPNNMVQFDTIIASQKLTEDPFDHKKSIACELHKDLSGGLNHCSKSIVQRWIFVLCLYCCSLFDIELVSGCHIPQEASLEVPSVCDLFSRMKTTEQVKKQEESATYLKNASGRNYREERIRRVEALKQPLTIIQHSTSDISAASTMDSFNPIELDDTNFPSIGRGAGGKKLKKKNSIPKHW